MRKRIFSTIALWALLILCLRFGGTRGAVWLVTAMSVLTLHEFYAMLPHLALAPFHRLGLLLAAAITLAPCYLEPEVTAAEILALGVIVFAVRILGEREPQNRVETLAWSLFGLVYVPFMLQFLVRIILLDQPRPGTGLAFCVWLIAVTKLCDTGALLTGLAIGRHKLAPDISPKKTWEGVAGGLATAVLIGGGVVWGARSYFPTSFSPGVAALAAVPIAGLAIISDLVESVIKRRAEIKDAGRTIPGIGGIFDLSDSLILTAPAGWVLFHWL